jgi:hypothetical protein
VSGRGCAHLDHQLVFQQLDNVASFAHCVQPVVVGLLQLGEQRLQRALCVCVCVCVCVWLSKRMSEWVDGRGTNASPAPFFSLEPTAPP